VPSGGQAPVGSQTPPGGRPPYPSPSSQHPIRLRDPLPVHSEAFATVGSGGSRWIPAVLGVLVVAVIVVVIILAMNRGQGGGQPGQTTTPSIDVPSNSRTLPTHVPTVSR
jgi:hypothetical protein